MLKRHRHDKLHAYTQYILLLHIALLSSMMYCFDKHYILHFPIDFADKWFGKIQTLTDQEHVNSHLHNLTKVQYARQHSICAARYNSHV